MTYLLEMQILKSHTYEPLPSGASSDHSEV